MNWAYGIGIFIGLLFLALLITLVFVFYFSYLFPRDENGKYSLKSRLEITWNMFRLMTGLLSPERARGFSGIHALYKTWDHHLVTERTLYINFGYWEKARNLDDACEALAGLLADRADFGPRDTVLDVGFGFGDQDMYWAENRRAKKITGLNVTPHQVETARRRVAEKGLGKKIDLQEGSATDIPFKDKTFTRVAALECAFHFRPREKFFQEAHRVLKPGGRMVAADIIAPLRIGWKEKILMRYGHSQWQIPMENFYNRHEYERRLLEAGFDRVEIFPIQELVWPPLKKFMLEAMKSDRFRKKLHPLHRNPFSRFFYVTSTCFLWPLLKLEYIVAVAYKGK